MFYQYNLQKKINCILQASQTPPTHSQLALETWEDKLVSLFPH